MRNGFILTLLTLMLFFPLSSHAEVETIFYSGFEQGECVGFNGVNDSIIVPVVHITGDFSLNKQPFPNSEYDDALFSLRDRVTGDEITLGNSHDNSYAVNVVPGQYDVIYSVQTKGAISPQNVGAVVMENVSLLADGSLNINVTAHTISGDFLHNGVAFPASEYDDGVIFLDGERIGRVELGATKHQSFADLAVIAGKYEVRYMAETPDTVPWNKWGYVGLLNVNADNNGLQINVESLALSGSFSHNNAPMPLNEFDDGNFYLETADGDQVLLGNSSSGDFGKRVMQAEYDVYWELETLGNTVPFNPRARVASGVDISGGTLDVNMQSSQVAGDFSLNGGAFPNTFQNTAQIILHDQVAGSDNVLGDTHDGSYSQRVLNGSYDIVYHHRDGYELPQNKHAIISEGTIIQGAVTLDIDVVARQFEASVYHNGVLFPASLQLANILLRNLSTGDLVFLGKTTLQNLSALVIPGTYDVYYSYLAGDQIPLNQMAKFRDGLVVSPPGDVVRGAQLNVNSIVANGSMLLNGAAMPASEYDDGILRFQFEEDLVPLGNTHDQTYQVRLLTQTEETIYWVYYQVETLGDNVPKNGDSRIMCVKFVPLVL